MNAEKANIQSSMDAAEIPEYVFESLARSLLPVIQKYYESEGGKKAFAEWKAKKEISDSASTQRNREDCPDRQSSRFLYYQSSTSSIKTINPNP